MTNTKNSYVRAREQETLEKESCSLPSSPNAKDYNTSNCQKHPYAAVNRRWFALEGPIKKKTVQRTNASQRYSQAQCYLKEGVIAQSWA